MPLLLNPYTLGGVIGFAGGAAVTYTLSDTVKTATQYAAAAAVFYLVYKAVK